MRVLIAFDKFKHALSARELCELTAQTLGELRPTWTLDVCPLTDGGDGFEEVLSQVTHGETHSVTTSGPRGGVVQSGLSTTAWSRIPPPAQQLIPKEFWPAQDDRIALIELARSSGIAGIPPELRDPWETSTHGTGQLILAARELGAKLIILGLGGSATNDLGLGALSALGLVFSDKNGKPLRPPTPQTWSELQKIEGHVLPAIPPIVIACDVENPLLGARGAAATFGRQKGLSPDRLSELETLSAEIARRLSAHCGKPEAIVDQPGAGAAGGTAWGLLCATRAQLIPGAEFVMRCLRLNERMAAADLIITGEGHFDATSFGGKGPGYLVAAAQAARKSIHVFAGKIFVAESTEVQLHQISPANASVDHALLTATGSNLVQHLRATFSSENG